MCFISLRANLLLEYNHTPYFPYSVTGAVDTFPVMVEQPEDNDIRHLLYNPKYGGCCYKFLCGCDFLGRIIAFNGPFYGLEYDGQIWEQVEKQYPRFDWEFLLGDGHFR